MLELVQLVVGELELALDVVERARVAARALGELSVVVVDVEETAGMAELQLSGWDPLPRPGAEAFVTHYELLPG
jgi:hypothetical protein